MQVPLFLILHPKSVIRMTIKLVGDTMSEKKSWGQKRYYSYNTYLRQKHGQKVGKLSLSAGLGCPNRDGTVSVGGCVFCSEDGSGTFAGCPERTIKEQLAEQKNVQLGKWNVKKFIAYFQSYTNTYGDVDKLRSLYLNAIEDPDVCGLAIATRPDCLGDDVLDLLEDINEKTHLWVELGLQTIHERTASWINRGYGLDVFDRSVKLLIDRGIEVVVHVIFGLPGETEDDMMETIKHIAALGLSGVKIHLLHIIAGTKLNEIYESKPFKVLEKDEYIDLVVKALELLPPEIVIHRFTGDGAKDTLVAPRWPLHKRSVLNGIDKRLRELDTWQSKSIELNNKK